MFGQGVRLVVQVKVPTWAWVVVGGIVALIAIWLLFDQVSWVVACAWGAFGVWWSTRSNARVIKEAAEEVRKAKPAPDFRKKAAKTVETVTIAELLAEENAALREDEW